MKLVLREHRVRDVAWANATRLSNGTLGVEREALITHLLEDPRLEHVDLQLVRPGESCRIVPVFDIVEPRCRADGADYPGVLGTVASVGSGSTTALRGMAVTIVSADPINADAPLMQQLLDMQALPIDDEGAKLMPTSYGQLFHVVIVPRVAGGLDRYERAHVLRRAGLRAGVFLARAAGDAVADEQQTFELDDVRSHRLPRVAYVFQLHSHQRPTAPGEPILYGDNARHLLPTILHPNEVLDGAVLPGYNSMGMETYAVQNHGVILDLYARHGRELDFAGVVAVVAHQTVAERQRTNVIAGNLVRHALQADGALFTKSGGGAPHVAMAEIARQCELLGVKTSLLAWEISEGESANEGSALFNYPELDAIVNYGCNGFGVPLRPVERVISSTAEVEAKLRGPLNVNANRLCGAMDQLGSGFLTAVRY